MKNLNFFNVKGTSTLFLIFLFIFQFNEVKAQFANGADVGWLSQMEHEGYVFKDNSGIQKNCLDILKEKELMLCVSEYGLILAKVTVIKKM